MIRDERPAPTVFHRGVIVPAELCAELATELEQSARTRRRAGQAGLPRAVAAVLKASRDAAALLELERHRQAASWAAPTPVPPVVLGTPQLAPESDVEEITTGNAEHITGLSAEWWRRLAVRGTIRGRQDGRGTWWLWKSDVVGYATHRPQETARAQHHDRPARPLRKAG